MSKIQYLSWRSYDKSVAKSATLVVSQTKGYLFGYFCSSIYVLLEVDSFGRNGNVWSIMLVFYRYLFVSINFKA